ncbi:hypothetical protein M8J75_015509 [Diaphorina citri]|nr:hypothetical protein M8J75_015509 [Diaphorina citri]
MGESFDESSINNDTNPDPCYIAGNIYYHGQQIARSDECEFCLCVDGEMFCYWQCPDEEEGEEEGGEPASTGVRSTTVRLINNTPATDSIASSIGRLRSTTQSSPQNTSLSRVEATSPHFASTPLDRATMNSSIETTESTDVTSSNTPLSESTTVVTSSEKTVSCFVLGK